MKEWAAFLRVLWIGSLSAGLAACGGTVDVPTGGDGGSGGITRTNVGGEGGAGAGTSTGVGAGTGDTGSGTTTTTITKPSMCGPEPVLPDVPCTPAAADCHSKTNACIAVHASGGAPQFDLRVVQIGISKPAALNNPLIAGIFESAMKPELPDCYLAGEGSTSWILSFDLASNSLQVGGAEPQLDPLAPYQLANFAMMGFETAIKIGPASGALQSNPLCEFESAPIDVNLPVYLDQGESLPGIVLPLRVLRLSGDFSPNHDCIGSYNAAQLDPNDVCEPGGGVWSFTPGGSMSALIGLYDADQVIIPALNNQSLCSLLTGESEGLPKRCPKDPATGTLTTQGDACLSTGQAATPQCADALFFEASFAASGVQVQP